MADELQVVNNQLPAEIGQLVNFVKLGREQLKIARDGLKMVNKMNLENEKRTAALRQVQELSEQLIDAEMKLGAIMATLPTAPGARTDLDEPEDSAVPRTKQAILKLAGFSVKTAQRFEMLAAHPEIVEKLKVEAHVNGTVLSRTAVLRAINEEETPSFDKKHVALTGTYYMNAIKVFSGRDDDYKEENSGIIKLVRPFDEEEVLSQEWNKQLLLVLPYQDIEPYVQKLCDSFESIPSAKACGARFYPRRSKNRSGQAGGDPGGVPRGVRSVAEAVFPAGRLKQSKRQSNRRLHEQAKKSENSPE